MTRNVLVIEDNRDIAHLVQLHLKDLDCDVQLALTAHLVSLSLTHSRLISLSWISCYLA